MKKIKLFLLTTLLPMLALAQGWPANYGGVMLQGFYWNSYDDTYWPALEAQAGELSQYFNLVWIPQSANCGGQSMGYDDLYWFSDYNSSFGTEKQLRSLIGTFKNNHIGTIADVVINHRKTPNDWFTFPAENYGGTTYKLLPGDICHNDDNGKAIAQAAIEGKTLSDKDDSGTGWDGMRDLDHHSLNVQTNVKAYLNMLLNDMGYAGFRYDMTKGYAASFTALYNSSSNPAYSVGEYWDENVAAVKAWINGTKSGGNIMSAAFDFPFRYTVRDAINKNDWRNLKNASLISDADYRRYAVTFVENHDTEYRSTKEQQDPILKDTLAANAFMLAMPGTPCVFLKHWQDYKQDIKGMIDVRKFAGINNQSASNMFRNNVAYFANKVTGTNCQITIAVGPNATAVKPANFTEIVSGHHYKYFMANTAETAWIDKASGEYTQPFNAKLSAVTATAGTQVAYTTDGSQPNANSPKVSGGTSIVIDKACTLKAGIVVNGKVTGIQERNYTFKTEEPFSPYSITVYLKDPTTAPNSWPFVNFYCWDSNNVEHEASWPGTTVNTTTMVKGDKFYYRTYDITSRRHYVNLVFNHGGSEGQTVDVRRISKDAFFEISSQTNKYGVNDITDHYGGGGDPFKGDIDNNGTVNVSDVTALINKILGTANYADNLCDIDNNGTVNKNDVTELINIILKL